MEYVNAVMRIISVQPKPLFPPAPFIYGSLPATSTP